MIFIVFLRAINVSGKHKIIMRDFVTILQEYPSITYVKSYIQSGNFVVKFNHKNTDALARLFSKIILENYGYDIATFCLSLEDLQRIYQNTPFPIVAKKNYLTFLKSSPNKKDIDKLKAISFSNDRYLIRENIIYLFFEETK